MDDKLDSQMDQRDSRLQRTSGEDGLVDPETHVPLQRATTSAQRIRALEAQLAEAQAALKQAEEANDKLFAVNQRMASEWTISSEDELSEFQSLCVQYPRENVVALWEMAGGHRPSTEWQIDYSHAAKVDADIEAARADLDRDISAGRKYLQRHPMTELLDSTKQAGDIYSADHTDITRADDYDYLKSIIDPATGENCDSKEADA